jgi:hypothetical protein
MQPQSRKSDPDIIAALIEDGLEAFPVSPLLIGLYQQYQKKGFLTKKQMQGLYSKVSTLAHINSGKLATSRPLSIKCLTGLSLKNPGWIQLFLKKTRLLAQCLLPSSKSIRSISAPSF